MTTQAQQTVEGRTVYRWFVFTGMLQHKIVWAESAEAARKKVQTDGVTVTEVLPVGSGEY